MLTRRSIMASLNFPGACRWQELSRYFRLLRQLLVTLVVLVVAVAGYVYFVPGSHETLQKLGLSIPGVTDGGNTQQQSGPAGAPGRGGGRGGFGGGARVITVGGRNSDLGPREFADDPPWGPLGCVPALQRLALSLGEVLGRDVDRPRNLAKSVTVA